MSSKSSLLSEAFAASNRRSFLRKAGVAGAVGALAPGLSSLFTPSAQAATPSPELDVAILNFALNLEYLEAQYYLYATTGKGISDNGGTTAGGDGTAGGSVTIKDNPQVPFTDATIAGIAQEIAQDEFNHVKFLQGALGGAAVAAPDLDLLNSFNTLAQLAGLSSFDPFESELNFLLGAFIFEDVGVTAYRGASPLIYDKAYIAPAAGILAVEALHAGEIRTLLAQLATAEAQTPQPQATTVPPTKQPTIFQLVQAISDARDSVDNANQAKMKDQGIQDANGALNLYPTDANGVAFGRTTKQVLRIVYGMPTGVKGAPKPGLFFPRGLNGDIK